MPFDNTAFVEQQDIVRDILRQARKRVAAGWCQLESHREGSYCIMGAVGVTVRFQRRGLFDAVLSELQAQLPAELRALGLPKYNDAAGRTQQEILDLFDRAIAEREGNNAV